jgi:hypothetical protein
MPGLSVYAEKNVLNYVTGQVAMPALPAVYMGLFTTQPTTGDSSGTEVSGASYARVQVAGTVTTNAATTTSSPTLSFSSVPAWLYNSTAPAASPGIGMSVYDATNGNLIGTVSSVAASSVTLTANAAHAVSSGDTLNFSAFGPATTGGGTAASTAVNTSIITFATPGTGGWGNAVGFGLFDALSGGDLLADDYLGAFAWTPATITSASPGVFTIDQSGYTPANGDSIAFTDEFGGTGPTGGALTGLLTVAGVSGNTFNVGVNTTSMGSGMIRKVASQSIPANVVASFAANTLTLAVA